MANKKPRLSVKMQAFLDMYPKMPVITRCCEQIGVNNRRFYEWLENPIFAVRWEEAKAQATDLLVAEVHHRAFHGAKRKKFTRDGDPIIDPETGQQYVEVTYGDDIYRLLARLDPDNWSQRKDSGNATASVNFNAGVSIPDMLTALQNDPDYLDYLRDRAVREATGNGQIEVTEDHSAT